MNGPGSCLCQKGTKPGIKAAKTDFIQKLPTAGERAEPHCDLR